MEELRKFWFLNKEIWFNSTPQDDELIYKRFYKLFANNPKNDFKKTDNDYIYLDYILLYDQITRHIARLKSDDTIIKKYQMESLEYANYLIDSKKYLNFKPIEICFILLPLRHTFELKNLEKVLNIIKTLIKDIPDEAFIRFYHATINSLIKYKTPIMIKYNSDINKYKHLLCTSCTFDINKVNYDNPIIDKDIVEEFKKHVKNKKVTISLSGGSDSMVAAFILKKLNYDVNAIMINYNNRDTSDGEVEIVNYFCKKIGIDLWVRKIDEINKINNDRNFYENVTKRIRFLSYEFLNRDIILGHNRDDCYENIITNIDKKRSFDNLLGMNVSSVQSNINIIRPLLYYLKSDIINIANKNNIPYLYDSTPKESERGKIRDTLVPYINSYNKNFLDRMLGMAERFKDIYESYNILIMNNTKFVEKVLDDKKVIEVLFLYCKDIDYWKLIFNKLNFEYSVDIPSLKSIKNFIKYLDKLNCKKIILSKNFYAKIYSNNMLIYNS